MLSNHCSHFLIVHSQLLTLLTVSIDFLCPTSLKHCVSKTQHIKFSLCCTKSVNKGHMPLTTSLPHCCRKDNPCTINCSVNTVDDILPSLLPVLQIQGYYVRKTAFDVEVEAN
ncbi:hypothetical protein TNCT_603511 [Trichonephila clavata]|uniref:Uncharacterized protein n=1 Tax=Trichonephila clavata TaxID=2740835 RepID=A0A8X6FUB2_TRICU|nr:hypothetical protein TNCT_603511 [Trichonephila clavata]